jgi:hypothetical protein
LTTSASSIALDDGADIVVITEVAVARIDGNAHGGGELAEQRLLAGAELVAILRHVGGRDFEQRLFVGVDIGLELSHGLGELHAGRNAQDLAREWRDAAIGIAGFDGAGAGQLLAQLVGFRGGNLGTGGSCAQQTYAQHQRCAHRLLLHCSCFPSEKTVQAVACEHLFFRYLS